MKKTGLMALLIAFLGASLMSCTSPLSEYYPGIFNPHAFQEGEYASKIDNLFVIVDLSDSMRDKYQNKIKFDLERDFLISFNKTLPNVQITSAIRAFGHKKWLFRDYTSLIYGPASHSRELFEEALKSISRLGSIDSAPNNPLALALRE